MFWDTIEYLKDPYHVAKFQRAFGVVRLSNGEDDSDTDDPREFEVTKKNRRTNYTVFNDNNVKDKNGYVIKSHSSAIASSNNGDTDSGISSAGSSDYSCSKIRHRRDFSGCSSVAESLSEIDSYDSHGSNGDSDQEKKSSKNYVIKNKFWYYLFCFGAGLGYELFYATFFPIWFWNIDGWVGRRMIIVWVAIMYIGQALKDVIKWPRPSAPPVVQLEPEYAIEYGMPSTHAMVGFALPASMLIFTYARYEYPLWIGLIFAFSWCLLVCGSRLYLGMHSYLDIIAGLILSAILMVVLLPAIDFLDQIHLKSPYAPMVSIPLIIMMATFYPKPERWSPARGDTCIIMGAGIGILLGHWICYQTGVIRGPGMPPPFPIIWPGYGVIGLAFLRACIGIICVVGSRAIGKICVFSLVCYIHNLDPKDPKTRLRARVEVPYKLLTYILMGLAITWLSPLVFRYLGIERVTMFTEV